MATPFCEIYDRAIFKFSDYEILKLDIQSREDVLKRYLMSAAVEFNPVCLFDLTKYDENNCAFDDDLTDECLEILALGVCDRWLSSRLLNSELLKNSLSTKDYSYYSPANLLEKINELSTRIRKEYKNAIICYSYNNNLITSLN